MLNSRSSIRNSIDILEHTDLELEILRIDIGDGDVEAVAIGGVTCPPLSSTESASLVVLIEISSLKSK